MCFLALNTDVHVNCYELLLFAELLVKLRDMCRYMHSKLTT